MWPIHVIFGRPPAFYQRQSGPTVGRVTDRCLGPCHHVAHVFTWGPPWRRYFALKGRVPPFLHKVVLRRANQPHNSHEDRFSMLWPSRTQSPPKSQITMVKVSGKHIWWHQACLPDTLTIVIWLLGGDCVRLGQSIEKRSSWELWGWFALVKTTLCKKGGTLPLSENSIFYTFCIFSWPQIANGGIDADPVSHSDGHVNGSSSRVHMVAPPATWHVPGALKHFRWP